MRIRFRASSSRLLIVPASLAIAACAQEGPTSISMRNENETPAAIIIEPPPGPSCTYTQGYWKNHSELWDEASDGMVLLAIGLFHNSGIGNLTILKTPPKGGNAYLILAHQFIAASLNLNGATAGVTEVDDAMSGAASYFAGEPAGIPKPVEPTRSQLIDWASTLESFNSGNIGPGHCS